MKLKNIFLVFLFHFICAQCISQAKSSAFYTETPFFIVLDELTIHGSLILPKKSKSKVPVALIIAGSGNTDRNGNNIAAGLNSDSYRQLACSLANSGIASLRYDKRGVGESLFTKNSEPVRDFDAEVKDVKLLVDLLQNDKRFSRIIIIGHSQGSLIGILGFGQANKFISIAGPGLKASETIKEQLSQQPQVIKEQASLIIDSLVMGSLVKNIPLYLEPLFKSSIQPYLISWFKYDPKIELAKINKPCLIVQGTNDIQIKISDAKALVSMSKKSRLVLVKNMNHILKIIPGSRDENLKSYSNPHTPISKRLVTIVVHFILK